MGRRKQHARDWSALIADYKSKIYTAKELSSRRSISVPRVYSVLKENGIKTHKTWHDMSGVDKEAVLHDYSNTDMRLSEITEKHCISSNGIYKILEERGASTRRPRITPGMEEKVADIYKKGKSFAEIANDTGLSLGVVRDSLVRQGIHKPKKFDEMRGEWKSLYESGAFLCEIADMYNVSRATVRNHLLQQGVELRDFRRQKRKGRSAA